MTAEARLVERRHRTAAAVLVALVATAVAAGAHALAGGGVPSVAAIAVALLISVTVGILAIGPRLTRTRTAVGVLVDQLVFHGVFAFFGPASTIVPDPAGHAHDHGATGLLAAVAPTAATAPTVAMVASHLGAALIAYGMLRSGIRAVESALRALGRAVARALDLPTAASPSTRRPVPAARFIAHRHQGGHVRLPDGRGPPLLAVA